LTTQTAEKIVPKLPAEDLGDGLKVRCIWCRCSHFHGPGYGHRVAHCTNPRSPYLATGYVLVPVPGDVAR
jgi:hypothetical protein